MKNLLLAFALVFALVAPASAKALYVFSDEDGYMHLTDESCKNLKVLEAIDPEVALRANHFVIVLTSLSAKKTIGKTTVEGCYVIQDGWVHAVNENLGTASAPLSIFEQIKVEAI
jgi:hypothetical protein